MTKNAITDATNNEQIEAVKRGKLDAATILKQDMRKLMSVPEFRRFMKRMIIVECSLLINEFNASGSRTYFDQGMRAVGLRLKDYIELADPDAFAAVLKEDTENE